MQHNVPQIAAQANVEAPTTLPARYAVPMAALHFGAVAAYIEAALAHAEELAKGETGDKRKTMESHIAAAGDALAAARKLAGDAEILTDAETVRKAGVQIAAALGACVEVGRMIGEALEAKDPINNRLAGRIVLMQRRTGGRGRFVYGP